MRFLTLFFITLLAGFAQTSPKQTKPLPAEMEPPTKAKAGSTSKHTRTTFADLRSPEEKAKAAAQESKYANGGQGGVGGTQNPNNSSSSTSSSTSGASASSNPFGWIENEAKYIESALRNAAQDGSFYTIQLGEWTAGEYGSYHFNVTYSAHIIRRLCDKFEKERGLEIQGTPLLIPTHSQDGRDSGGKALFFKALPKK